MYKIEFVVLLNVFTTDITRDFLLACEPLQPSRKF